MTGPELRRARLKLGMPIVKFGILVLGSKGDLNTVSRFVRRLEACEVVSERTAAKVRAALGRRRTMRNGGC